jgi:hypothetical protein
MGTLHCITIDCNDPATLSKFWGQAIEGYSDDPSGMLARSEKGPMMYFQQVPEGKAAKNRVHLELAAHDREEQLQRLISLGATKVQDFDQDGRKWTVMQDPEGGEFCISQGQAVTERPRLVEVVFDSGASAKTARFWEAALDGFAVRPYDDEEIARLAALGITDYLNDDPNVAVDHSGDLPSVFFQAVPEAKTTKNRLHIDIGAPDVDAEVARLASLGATVVQAMKEPHMEWTVMLDPESNEFCVCKV